MTNKLLAVLAALLFTACLDEGSDSTTTTRPIGDADRMDETQLPQRDDGTPDRKTDEDVPVCDQLVATEGPCAHACDEDAIMTFIPKGTCAMFRCELANGSDLNTGGCNW
jgi:hypothetical protein